MPRGYSVIWAIQVVVAPKSMVFTAVLVINRVWILYSSLNMGIFFKKKPLFRRYKNENHEKPFENVYGNLTLV